VGEGRKASFMIEKDIHTLTEFLSNGQGRTVSFMYAMSHYSSFFRERHVWREKFWL
jgi:hypothetical protein